MERLEFLFHISLILYLSSGALFIIELYSSKNFSSLPLWKVRTAFLFQTAIVILYRPFLLDKYYVLIFFIWIIVLIYLIIIYKNIDYKGLGAFIMPLSFLILVYIIASGKPYLFKDLLFINQWFYIHKIFAVIGCSFSAMAFFCGTIYFIQEKNLKDKTIKGIFRKLPSLILIEELSYKMSTHAFLFLTMAIISGSIWSQTILGTYWKWSYSENFLLATWFVYAIYIHLRIVSGWRGSLINIIIISGFLLALISLLI